ncbi:MAG: hypothetical protein QOH31_754, partial [Verrucomicrobiota bacterium]
REAGDGWRGRGDIALAERSGTEDGLDLGRCPRADVR